VNARLLRTFVDIVNSSVSSLLLNPLTPTVATWVQL